MGSSMEITIPSRKHGPRMLRLAGAVPHQLVSGEMITLSVFRAECVKCRSRFYTTAPGDACDDIVPNSFGTVHCIGHRRRTTDHAIRRHAELAERFDTEDERTRQQLVWDGSLSFACGLRAVVPRRGWRDGWCNRHWLGSRVMRQRRAASDRFALKSSRYRAPLILAVGQPAITKR
jgi:hypothetical protein